MTPDDKHALRRTIRRARMALPKAYRLAAAQAVARHARRFLARGRRIGGYLAAGSELDLEPLMSAALFRGAALFLPQIPDRGRRLWFSKLGSANRWSHHPRYGIAEYHGPVRRAHKLDVLFVPLLGVDEEGYRLGQGGGFYDATLAFRHRQVHRRRPLLVGVAYDCQRVARVPREPWDVQLDYLVTESGLHHFPRRPAVVSE
jgi:5-formyltetrahydrofolate cyclo-ligase